MKLLTCVCTVLTLFFLEIYTVCAESRPNILFCISDDQSYIHTGANGDKIVQTPAFDRVAREGLRFLHAFCDAPTCGPSRSAILTGQPIWRLEEAGKEIERASLYDHIVVNEENNLPRTVEKINNIIISEKNRIPTRKMFTEI